MQRIGTPQLSLCRVWGGIHCVEGRIAIVTDQIFLNLWSVEALTQGKNRLEMFPLKNCSSLSVFFWNMVLEHVCMNYNCFQYHPTLHYICAHNAVQWPYTHQVCELLPFTSALGFAVEEYAASKGKIPPRKRRKKVIYIATIEKVWCPSKHITSPALLRAV